MIPADTRDCSRSHLFSPFSAQYEPMWQQEYEAVLSLVKIFGSLFRCVEVAEKAILARCTALDQSADHNAEWRAMEEALANLARIKAELVEFSKAACAQPAAQPRDEKQGNSLVPKIGSRDHPKRGTSVPATKILLVDDTEDLLRMMSQALEDQNFEVVRAASVTEALTHIVTQSFDVLITDLHMPGPGDGFAVVTAMRHAQPKALNLVISEFPDLQAAMSAILLQADEVLVKPFEVKQLADLIRKKVQEPQPSLRPIKDSVASILERDLAVTIQNWLSRMNQVEALASIRLTDQQRTEYLTEMLKDIAARLRRDRTVEAIASPSPAAVAHGALRQQQGYTAPLIVQESRILQVSIFETIQRNLSNVDFSLVLPDIMLIADEVDSQLTQSVDSFLRAAAGAAAA